MFPRLKANVFILSALKFQHKIEISAIYMIVWSIARLLKLKEVNTIQSEQAIIAAKHYKPDSSRPRHIDKVRTWRKTKLKILKILISAELVGVVLACCFIYSSWCHNIEMRAFGQVCSATVSNASVSMQEQTTGAVSTYLESVAEEVYEYVWTTGKTAYRTGADDSYKKAGTLETDKMVRRTGITHNGWSRIALDEKDYYVAAGTLTDEIPDSLPIADGIKGEYQKYALSLLPDFGWDSSELEPLIYLWNRESGWNPSSHNRSSGAHGIPQALPGSKMASEGSDYMTNPEPQIRWGLKYIAGRYGSPSAAWAHFCSRGWY